MSHFTVMVVCPAGTTVDNYEDPVTELMAPYDENRDVVWQASEDADDEDGGYWTNPDGHWDYWTVGGRWRGYFPVAAGIDPADFAQLLITDGRPNRMTGRHDGFDPEKQEGRADGGPKRLLGIDKLRDQRGREAVAEWNNYAAAIQGTEQHPHLDDLVAKAEQAEQEAALVLGANRRGLIRQCNIEVCRQLGLEHNDDGHPVGASEADWERYKARDKELWPTYDARWRAACPYSTEDLRRDYWHSERVEAVHRHPAFKGRFLDADQIDALDRCTRDEYEQRARALAVPTFAVVMPDGSWCAPGRMGWFGMSSDSESDRVGFAERINSYLDELADDMFLVVVDCHV